MGAYLGNNKTKLKLMINGAAFRVRVGKLSECEHSYTATEVVATCTEQGYTKYSCSLCGNIYYDNYVSAKGHTEATDKAVAATCTTTGLTEGKHCSVCNTVLIAQQTIGKLDHVISTSAEWSEDCTSVTISEICDNCNGTINTEEFSGSDIYTHKLSDATCAEPEKYDHRIRYNGTEYYCVHYHPTGEVNPNNHDPVNCKCVFECQHINKEPREGYDATCTEDGLTDGTWCNDCEQMIVAQTPIEATGHSGKTITGQASTCSEAGWKDYYQCENCNKYFSDKACIVEISDIDTWKKGDGKLPLAEHTECEAQKADCFVDGWEAGYKCSVCNTVLDASKLVPAGHVKSEKPAHADDECHVYYCINCAIEIGEPEKCDQLIEHAGKAPTCSEKGYTSYKSCSICGQWFGYTVLEKNEENHVNTIQNSDEFDHWIYCNDCNTVLWEQRHEDSSQIETLYGYPATCTEPGLTNGKKCLTCGVIFEKQTEIPATGHKYNKVVTEPDCTNEGYTTYTCSVCGDTYTGDKVEPLGHIEIPADKYRAPTCTQAGQTAGKACSRCEVVYEQPEPIPATGHTIETHEAKEPTCTEIGWYEYETCTECNYTTYKQIEATGHDGTGSYKYDNLGHWKICRNCGEEIMADPHPDSGIVPAKAATCTEDGYEEYMSCSICGYTAEKVTIPASHDCVEQAGKAATCTEDGWKSYYQCQREECNQRFEDSDGTKPIENLDFWKLTDGKIPATGHTEETVPAQAPTCTSIGYTEGKKCSKCQVWIEEPGIVDSLGHSYDAGTVTTKPSCEDPGVRTFTCKNDSSHTRTELIPATGHTEAEQLSYDEHGHELRCVTCETVLWADVHNGLTPAREATCTEPGNNEYGTCSTCGYTVEKVEITAPGHAWEELSSEPEYCSITNQTGQKIVNICTRCGEKQVIDDPHLYSPKGVCQCGATNPLLA